MNYKKYLIFFLLILFSTNSLAVFSGGNGSKNNPYIITNCIQLQEMNNYLSSYFVLGNDIDCSEKNFVPIGSDSKPFRGSLDGNYCIIKKLNISVKNRAVGLFGKVEGVTIKNLGIENGLITLTITNSSGYAGCLIGKSVGETTILNSYCKDMNFISINNSGDSYNSYKGGILGKIDSGKTILRNVFSRGGTTQGFFIIKGLIGESSIWDVIHIINSFVGHDEVSSISSYDWFGAWNGRIENSFSLIFSEEDKFFYSNAPNLSKINSYCYLNGNITDCRGHNIDPFNYSSFFSSEHPVYNNWKDGNWEWVENDLPFLKSFFYCRGPIDEHAVHIEGDLDKLGPNDELVNVLVEENTSRKCEWVCKNGYYKGSGVNENKCLPNACVGRVSNALYYCGDDEGFISNEEVSSVLVDENTGRKCEMYCKEGCHKEGNSCVLNTCLNRVRNALYYEGDDVGIILEEEKNSVLTDVNTSRKCEMYCKSGYRGEGDVCVIDVIVPKCTGTIPDNSKIISEEEETDLEKNIEIMLVDANTPRKCEYVCEEGFIRIGQKCVAPNKIGECGSAAKGYLVENVFPIGELCKKGNPFPASLTLGVNPGDVVNWVCVSDVNANCAARRIKKGEEICSIEKMVPIQEPNGALFVEVKCSCNTQIDLNFFDYDEGTQLFLQDNLSNSFDCNTNGNKKGIGFKQPITQNTLIQVKGSIKKNSPDCLVCETTEYLAYKLVKEEIIIPDNSIVFVLIIFLITGLILFNKNKVIN